MTGRRFALVMAVALLSTPGAGAEVIEQRFEVDYTLSGQRHSADQPVVPLLPGNTCYHWSLRLAESSTPVKLVERFTLPEPLADWGTTGTQPDDPTRIEEEGKVAVTTIEQGTDSGGWVSHGWCAAEGDPLGRHVMDISADGVALASFEFDVVAPQDYRFPPFDPAIRSSLASW